MTVEDFTQAYIRTTGNPLPLHQMGHRNVQDMLMSYAAAEKIELWRVSDREHVFRVKPWLEHDEAPSPTQAITNYREALQPRNRSMRALQPSYDTVGDLGPMGRLLHQGVQQLKFQDTGCRPGSPGGTSPCIVPPGLNERHRCGTAPKRCDADYTQQHHGDAQNISSSDELEPDMDSKSERADNGYPAAHVHEERATMKDYPRFDAPKMVTRTPSVADASTSPQPRERRNRIPHGASFAPGEAWRSRYTYAAITARGSMRTGAGAHRSLVSQ